MAIYPNESTTFSVWLATVSSANFSGKGFIACSRQLICTINNTAARASAQDPGYKWFHTLLFTTMLDAQLGKHGAQGPHLGLLLPRPGVLILTLVQWEWDRDCMDRRGRTTWLTHVHIYVHCHLCQHAHESCSSSVHQHGLHPIYIPYHVVAR